MSLINQVLNDLEKRGANGALVETSIRAVPVQHNSKTWAYLLAGIVLLVGVGGAGWLLHKPGAVPQAMGNVTPISAGNVPALSPVGAAPQPLAESRVALAEQTAAQEYVVASRLSFELSSIPLPNSLRGKLLVEPAAPIPDSEATPVAAHKSAAAVRFEPAAPVSKQMKKVSPQQQAENEYRKANLLAQQGQMKEAALGYESALHLGPEHALAREALVAVLLESKRNADAEKALQDGLAQNPKQPHFAMLLARLQVERNAVPLALETLGKTLPYAEQQADYQAFMAALLQRQNRHKEAITHYQIALQLSPGSGLWFMGSGISLQAVQRKEDALDAYKRAIDTRSLSPELQAFVLQRMQEIKEAK